VPSQAATLAITQKHHTATMAVAALARNITGRPTGTATTGRHPTGHSSRPSTIRALVAGPLQQRKVAMHNSPDAGSMSPPAAITKQGQQLTIQRQRRDCSSTARANHSSHGLPHGCPLHRKSGALQHRMLHGFIAALVAVAACSRPGPKPGRPTANQPHAGPTQECRTSRWCQHTSQIRLYGTGKLVGVTQDAQQTTWRGVAASGNGMQVPPPHSTGDHLLHSGPAATRTDTPSQVDPNLLLQGHHHL
jgi:hypothetical protein